MNRPAYMPQTGPLTASERFVLAERAKNDSRGGRPSISLCPHRNDLIAVYPNGTVVWKGMVVAEPRRGAQR